MSGCSNETIVKRTYEEIDCLWSQLDPALYGKIQASRGLFSIVDKDFLSSVAPFRWYAVISSNDHIYAVADIEGKRISLQRYVLAQSLNQGSFANVKHVSFKNKNTLDCRAQNLSPSFGRKAVMRNRRPKRGTSSAYKGVIRKQRKDGSYYFRTQIKGDLGSLSVGNFDSEIVAAQAYDAAASILFGENGYQNFPDKHHSLELMENAAHRIKRYSEKKQKRS